MSSLIEAMSRNNWISSFVVVVSVICSWVGVKQPEDKLRF